jgi:hypothetical protein
MIEVKILSCRAAQRYAVRQRVVAAKRDLQNEYPNMGIQVTELKDWGSIEPYTPILAAPSLVVNERLVCEAKFPTRLEIVEWMRNALIDERT